MAGIIQHIKLLPLLVLILMISGCASRMDNPVIENEITKIYKLKDGSSVVDNIQFCRKIDRKTGALTGEGEKFTIMDDGRIQAIVYVSNYIRENEKLSMFHFDWISASGYTTYLKRVDFTPNDSFDYIKSSISINPEIRTPGEYKLRIYYFRELIAEKEFEFLPQFDPTLYNLQALAENLVICKKGDKKTGKPLEVNSEFYQSNKGSVRASFKLDKELFLDQQEQLYRFDWYIEGDTLPFYRKHVDVLSSDSLAYISSSLSVSPDKREAGEYFVVLILFGKPIAQKEFLLLPPLDYSAVKANIILYKKKSKKSGNLLGKGTQFKIGKKNKVRARVLITGLNEFIDKELEFKLRWIGPDGKTVYSKKYMVIPEKSSTIISSSISLKPGKRKPGDYRLTIYLDDVVVEEQVFELR